MFKIVKTKMILYHDLSEQSWFKSSNGLHVLLLCSASFFSRPSPKAGRELQTELDRIMDDAGTLIEKSAGAGHRAVSLPRGCVLVFNANL